MELEVSFDAVELHEATFGKAPECLDAVDMRFAFDQGSSFLDADMLVIAHINQPVVADPLIGVQDAGRINSAANDLSAGASSWDNQEQSRYRLCLPFRRCQRPVAWWWLGPFVANPGGLSAS